MNKPEEPIELERVELRIRGIYRLKYCGTFPMRVVIKFYDGATVICFDAGFLKNVYTVPLEFFLSLDPVLEGVIGDVHRM